MDVSIVLSLVVEMLADLFHVVSRVEVIFAIIFYPGVCFFHAGHFMPAIDRTLGLTGTCQELG